MPIHMHFKKGRRESARFRYYFKGSNPPSPLFSPPSPLPCMAAAKEGQECSRAGLTPREERDSSFPKKRRAAEEEKDG